MKFLLVSLACLCVMSFNAQALKIYLLSNHDNAGDHNQTLGIKRAYDSLSDKQNPMEDVNTKTTSSSAIKDKVEKDLADEEVIVIGAGEGGVDGIAELPKHPNLITCLTSHMLLDRYKDEKVLKEVDFIALPTHVAPSIKEALGDKLIETTGVAHNRCLDMAVYEKWKQDLPPADVYLGVYLGGDAPTPTNEIKLFTEEDASRLADYVSKKAKAMNEEGQKTWVLVLNGPRTGKYDADKKEILDVHRAGKADRVTDSFGKKLAQSDIKYKIFDFQHTPENKPPYNAFDLVVDAVVATRGNIIVPGESTSVISEAIDITPSQSINAIVPGKILVYNNSAMNEVHAAHVASELMAGRIAVLENYQDMREPVVKAVGARPSAAQVIAQRLLQAAQKD